MGFHLNPCQDMIRVLLALSPALLGVSRADDFLNNLLPDVDFDHEDCKGDTCFPTNQLLHLDRVKTGKLTYNERSVAYASTQNILAACLPGVAMEIRRRREAGKNSEKKGRKASRQSRRQTKRTNKKPNKPKRPNKPNKPNKKGNRNNKKRGNKNKGPGRRRNNKKKGSNRKNKGKGKEKKPSEERKFVNKKPDKEPSKENEEKIKNRLAKLGLTKMPTPSTLSGLECLWDELENLLVACAENIASTNP